MFDIIHKIAIAAPLEDVHEALATSSGVAGWWTKSVSLEEGGGLRVRFEGPSGAEIGRMMFGVALEEGRVRWTFVEGPPEWIGTEVTFEVERRGEQTIVRFGHRGWRESSEFMAHCSMKWATFLLSLRAFVETGVGRPAPNDLKIDDWN